MPSTLRGKFLIATPALKDPNFFRSVVLIVEHNSDGAMGLIVNRPSSVTVARALEGHFELPETGELVYIGGPVEPSALFILHNSSKLDSDEKPVVPGVFVGSSGDIFQNVVRHAEQGNLSLRFRILSGCAGWGPGQLEGELSRGDWLLRPGTSEITFSSNPYEVWETVVGQVSTGIKVIPTAPGNPEWN